MKRRVVSIGVLLAVGLMVAWFYPRLFGADVYTLYRNSPLDVNAAGYSTMRIHVAIEFISAL
jgi:hypothetical protein